MREIKKELASKEMTQEDLALAIGKHPQSLSRNFALKSSISLKTLQDIFRVLKLDQAIYNIDNTTIKFESK